MKDFVTMWKEMLEMSGKDNAEKIDAYLNTLNQDEIDYFLLMLQNGELPEELEPKV